MPTYGYVCEKCGHEFEVFQSMTDKPLTVCPRDVCNRKPWGRGRVRRQIGAGAGLLFKGSGFYITDYRSSGYHEAAKKDKPAASASASSGEGKSSPTPAKTEAKPAAAKPAKKGG
jgi:putative FmdB family regulatory protein